MDETSLAEFLYSPSTRERETNRHKKIQWGPLEKSIRQGCQHRNKEKQIELQNLSFIRRHIWILGCSSRCRSSLCFSAWDGRGRRRPPSLSRPPFYNLILPVQISQSCANRKRIPIPTLGYSSCILTQATPVLALARDWPNEASQPSAPILSLTIGPSTSKGMKTMLRQLLRASTTSGRKFPASLK